jgi:hypothetical protein
MKSSANLALMVFMQIAFTGIIYAQNTDSSLVIQQINSTVKYYNNKIADQSRLLNGIKYLPYKNQNYVGHAYYNIAGFQIAYLNYDSVDFYDVPVLYDVHKDILIIKTQDGLGYMSLLSSKLDRFTINNHTFIKIVADNNEKKIKTGFYDILFDARVQLLAKRSKAIEVEKSGITIDNLFVPYTKYFLYKANTYYEVSDKKDMLKVLKDKKQELELYIKTNNLDFKNDELESAMIKLTAYYNQLSR